MKDILVHIDNKIPEPYLTYIKGRNVKVADYIANLGESRQVFSESEILLKSKSGKNYYHIPSKPISSADAEKYGIKSSEDIFGGVVEDLLHANKGILHTTLSNTSLHPSGYSQDFPKLIRNAVLPGYTAFSKAEAVEIMKCMNKHGTGSVRLKDPLESDASGQYVITNTIELDNVLSKYSDKNIFENGLVLEANINEAVTLSVGLIIFGNQEYSYFGKQKSVFHNGRSKYGGTEIAMFRGNFNNLINRVDTGSNLHIAISQTSTVFDAFGTLDPILSRANFDVVQGFNNKGEFLSGVTDQSFRLGGASPAEVLAISKLNSDKNIECVNAEVDLIYDPTSKPPDPEDVIFLDHSTLKIISRVKSPNKKCIIL